MFERIKLNTDYTTEVLRAIETIHRLMGLKVIFNEPYTIIRTKESKAIVKCHNEEFDEEKGLFMALLKLNGYPHSRLKSKLETIGCTTDKAEKAYAYAVLKNKYYYSDESLAVMLKNAIRQNKNNEGTGNFARKIIKYDMYNEYSNLLFKFRHHC